MQYIVNTEDLYLTFLTHNDSYMVKVPKGAILQLKDGYLEYNGKVSTDDEVGLVYYNFISPFSDSDSRTVL